MNQSPIPGTGGSSSGGSSVLPLLTGVVIILLLIAGFAVYYETVGYWILLGWTHMRWSRDHGETIVVESPGGGLAAELKPLEKDVAIALSDAASSIAPADSNQVFNIASNVYNYEEAEPLCRAFGAELATYDQVKEAYDRGADWCNYGWSKGQLALFPTQQHTFDRLQREGHTEEERESCGVPGVNGGYFPNPDQRFGVNCYGPKPPETELDKRNRHHAMTPSEAREAREVARFRAELPSIVVNPWSPHQWSA